MTAGIYNICFGRWGLYDYDMAFCKERYFTKCELEEDQVILGFTLDWLFNGTESPCENGWKESLGQLITIVQKVNRCLLAWMLDTDKVTNQDDVFEPSFIPLTRLRQQRH